MLSLLIVLLVLGGVLAWTSELWYGTGPRTVALVILVLNLVLALQLGLTALPTMGDGSPWFYQELHAWIPRFGISYQLGIDGLSLVLVLLTLFLGIIAVASAWFEIQERPGFFYCNLLWGLAGAIGVFVALDMFLFFSFWELMLVPMYFLIAVWGHENRRYAAIKFFIFTQGSSLLMLIAILALVFVHEQLTGQISFNYFELLGTELDPVLAFWLMLCFFLAFAVKLPAIPLHPWLPDAHTEAPTAGSVILAGVLLKTGAYGLIRFVIPLFPDAALQFAPVAMTLGAIGVIYGAAMAFAQTDFKRLVAYSSVSHLGFVLIGIFAWNELALQGVVMQMLAHGISAGALFMLAGALQERLHTRDMTQMGGLWSRLPKIGGTTLFFVAASLGLPGLANFVGEFLVLLGTWPVNVPVTVVAAIGLITAVVYSLALLQRSFQGESRSSIDVPDLTRRETASMGALVFFAVALGIGPQAVFMATAPAVAALQERTLVPQQDTASTGTHITGRRT